MITIKFLKNFREFAVRGTVVDMGIGVIVGTAFIKIVDSLVSDIIMPPLGLILGKVNFSNLYVTLSGGHYPSLIEAKKAGAVTLNYGLFIDSIIHFAIVALATYFTILQINVIKKAPKESLSSKECPFCFTNIPLRAGKCPNCTTDLPAVPHLEKAKKLPTLEIAEERQGAKEPIVKEKADSREIKIKIKSG